MRNLPFLFLFFLSTSFILPDGKVPVYELEEAIEKGLAELIGIEYVGDDQVSIKVKNLHKRKDFKIHFKTGLQLASQDTSEQDQIILRGRNVLVRAGKFSSPKFTSYCTQASNINPGKGSVFQLKELADGALQELAQFLSKKRDMEYMVQQAIWVITDDHDLKGLHHDDPEKAINVQQFVSELTGKPLPEYTIRYKEARERQRAFTREPIMIYGVHKYQLKEDGIFSCKIYNEAGELVQEVFEKMPQKKGNVRFTFKLEARNLPKGKYVSRIFKEEQVFHEVWVESV